MVLRSIGPISVRNRYHNEASSTVNRDLLSLTIQANSKDHTVLARKSEKRQNSQAEFEVQLGVVPTQIDWKSMRG